MISAGAAQVNAASLGETDLVGISLGEVELWPQGSTSGLVVVEDTSTGTGLLQWEYGGPTGAWQKSNVDHYSGVAGATARLRFYGTSATVYGAKDAHHGQVSVSVDGGTATTVSMYAATRDATAVLTSTGTLAEGFHDVLLTVLGTKDTASSGFVIAVDKARVAALTPTALGFDVTVDAHTLGTTENTVAYAGTWGNTAANYYSGTAGSTFTLRWTGSQARIFGAKDAHHGQASVAIDGGAARTIDAYSAVRVDDPPTAIYDSGPIAPAAHTLVLTVLGTKQAASTGTVVAVAYAIVRSTTSAPPATASRILTESGARILTQAGARLTTG